MRNMAVVAGAAALLPLAAVPAHAQDAWDSIAVGETHRGDAVAYAVAWNHDTRAGAREAAMNAFLSGCFRVPVRSEPASGGEIGTDEKQQP